MSVFSIHPIDVFSGSSRALLHQEQSVRSACYENAEVLPVDVDKLIAAGPMAAYPRRWFLLFSSCSEGEVVGSARCTAGVEGNPAAVSLDICVLPEVRGQGLGNRLLQASLEWASSINPGALQITCWGFLREGTPAQKWCLHAGFTREYADVAWRLGYPATVQGEGLAQSPFQLTSFRDLPDRRVAGAITPHLSALMSRDDWGEQETMQYLKMYERAGRVTWTSVLFDDSGDLAAFGMSAFSIAARRGWQYACYVAPDHRGVGLGGRFLRQVYRDIFPIEVESLGIVTRDDNQSMEKTLGAMGFERERSFLAMKRIFNVGKD